MHDLIRQLALIPDIMNVHGFKFNGLYENYSRRLISVDYIFAGFRVAYMYIPDLKIILDRLYLNDEIYLYTSVQ